MISDEFFQQCGRSAMTVSIPADATAVYVPSGANIGAKLPLRGEHVRHESHRRPERKYREQRPSDDGANRIQGIIRGSDRKPAIDGCFWDEAAEHLRHTSLAFRFQ